MKKYLKNTHGFTLVELMVVLAVFLVVMGSLFGVLTSGRRAWLTSEAQIDLFSQARLIMDRISQELAEAGPGTVTITTISVTDDSITFQTPQSFSGGAVNWGDRIQYLRGGSDQQQLVRNDLDSGQTETVYNYLTTLRFNQLSADLIEIVLVLTRVSVVGDALQMQLTSQVALRNR